MKKAVILHGVCSKKEYLEKDFPSPSNAHWLPWLQQKFLRADILCQTLEMPTPYDPVYTEWEQTFNQLDTSSLSVIVGHSAGCGFILKWLHNNPQTKLDKLILVAPWLDPTKEKGDFLEFDLKPNALDNITEIHLLMSTDDMPTITDSANKIINIYPQIVLHKYENKGHFTSKYIGNTFEELWTLCKE